MLCVHNIDDVQGRARALDEMVRVLRPGGKIVVADLAGIDAYAEHLRGLGLDVEVMGVAWGTFPFQRTLVARKRPW